MKSKDLSGVKRKAENRGLNGGWGCVCAESNIKTEVFKKRLK